jgi:hypothetical protein
VGVNGFDPILGGESADNTYWIADTLSHKPEYHVKGMRQTPVITRVAPTQAARVPQLLVQYGYLFNVQIYFDPAQTKPVHAIAVYYEGGGYYVSESHSDHRPGEKQSLVEYMREHQSLYQSYHFNLVDVPEIGLAQDTKTQAFLQNLRQNTP